MTERRVYATGKRKSAIARVYMKEGTGVWQVNKRNFDDYLHARKPEDESFNSRSR